MSMNAMNKKKLSGRYDIYLLFDCRYGNPNGDPDADNSPRQSRDGSGHGYVTDVCIKRKIRDVILKYIQEGRISLEGNDMYIQPGPVLDARDIGCAKNVGIVSEKQTGDSKVVKKAISAVSGTDKDIALRNEMCNRYFDVRAFGAVMTMMANTQHARCVNGPVQVSFADSIDPIMPELVSVHRCVVTKEEKEKAGSTFGSKFVIPYGLYKCAIHISALKAEKTGFSEDDLNLLIQALQDMFEDDHSSLRGEMTVRKLIVMKHDSKWGNAPAQKLESLLHAEKKPGIEFPHSFGDYNVWLDTENVPDGVTVSEIV